MKRRTTILVLLSAITIVGVPVAVAAAGTAPAASDPPSMDDPENRRLPSRDNGGDGPGGWKAWLQMLLALAIVVGLIIALRWAIGRLGGQTASTESDVLRVVSRTAVTTKQELVLVRMGGRLVLVGRSPAGMARLGEVDDPAEVERIVAGKAAREQAEGGEA
ncbi:MAG: FliO/MopB family protein [Phycisphaerae bacterium]|nr:FliO/MopB family protein [Phycisphaerae bacterium]